MFFHTASLKQCLYVLLSSLDMKLKQVVNLIVEFANEKFLYFKLFFTIFHYFKMSPTGLMHIPHYLWIRHFLISILRFFAKEEEIN